MLKARLLFVSVGLLFTDGFIPVQRPCRVTSTHLGVSMSPEALQQGNFEQDPKSYYLTKEEAGAIVRIGKDENEKIINLFGVWSGIVSLITMPLWMMAMSSLNFFYRIMKDFDPNRSLYDKSGKIWAKVWLSMINSYPTVSGDLQQIKENQGPCLYVANHASWLDIPVLCTVLESVFKFIAKGELRKVPCIGQQLAGGHHILIDREDRKSQLRTFKEGLGWLKNGVPVMAFPEGMRSRDGRLSEFKKGIFSMAVKMNVPIVPITLSHTHAVMPYFCLLPVQAGAGKVHVHINKAIDSQGKTEAELEALVRKVFLETLPASQLPLPSNGKP